MTEWPAFTGVVSLRGVLLRDWRNGECFVAVPQLGMLWTLGQGCLSLPAHHKNCPPPYGDVYVAP